MNAIATVTGMVNNQWREFVHIVRMLISVSLELLRLLQTHHSFVPTFTSAWICSNLLSAISQSGRTGSCFIS